MEWNEAEDLKAPLHKIWRFHFGLVLVWPCGLSGHLWLEKMKCTLGLPAYFHPKEFNLCTPRWLSDGKWGQLGHQFQRALWFKLKYTHDFNIWVRKRSEDIRRNFIWMFGKYCQEMDVHNTKNKQKVIFTWMAQGKNYSCIEIPLQSRR